MIGSTRMHPMTKASLSFAGLLILGQVIYGIISYFVEFQSSSMGIVLLMAAGMGAGQTFGASQKRAMTPRERAMFAVYATAIGLAIGAAGMLAVFKWYGVPFSMDALLMSMGKGPADAAELRGFLWIGLSIAVVVSLIVTYFASGFGAKAAVRQLEKRGQL
jgi:hypothetical protein